MFQSSQHVDSWNLLVSDLEHLANSKKILYKQWFFDTLTKFNIAPENGWLEYYFPIGEAYFQGLC